MSMQTIIKKKRKEIGLTQEQIAEYLGVTTPAVNKWENGSTFPDISLLAPLARLLKTDLNTLLCFEEDLTVKEINNFSKETMDIIMKKDFESGLNYANNIIKKFPSNDKLIHNLVLLLEGALIIKALNQEERVKYEEQINNLYERITKSEDTEIRNGALYMLASKYIQKDQFEKAQSMIDLLPNYSSLDKRLLQANLLDKKGNIKEAEDIRERIMLMKITDVWSTLISLIEMEIKINNLEIASVIANICSRSSEIFQLSDYYVIVPLFQLAVAKKDKNESLDLMDKLLASTKKSWVFTESVIFKDINLYKNIDNNNVDKDSNTKKSVENGMFQILPALLNEIETKSDYEFLRGCDEYRDLLKKYQNTCLI